MLKMLDTLAPLALKRSLKYFFLHAGDVTKNAFEKQQGVEILKRKTDFLSLNNFGSILDRHIKVYIF